LQAPGRGGWRLASSFATALRAVVVSQHRAGGAREPKPLTLRNREPPDDRSSSTSRRRRCGSGQPDRAAVRGSDFNARWPRFNTVETRSVKLAASRRQIEWGDCAKSAGCAVATGRPRQTPFNHPRTTSIAEVGDYPIWVTVIDAEASADRRVSNVRRGRVLIPNHDRQSSTRRQPAFAGGHDSSVRSASGISIRRVSTAVSPGPSGFLAAGTDWFASGHRRPQG